MLPFHYASCWRQGGDCLCCMRLCELLCLQHRGCLGCSVRRCWWLPRWGRHHRRCCTGKMQQGMGCHHRHRPHVGWSAWLARGWASNLPACDALSLEVALSLEDHEATTARHLHTPSADAPLVACTPLAARAACPSCMLGLGRTSHCDGASAASSYASLTWMHMNM